LPLHTKIEFSRRGIGEPVVFEPVDSLIMREYQLTPILASHYPPEAALEVPLRGICNGAPRTGTPAPAIGPGSKFRPDGRAPGKEQFLRVVWRHDGYLGNGGLSLFSPCQCLFSIFLQEEDKPYIFFF
jgi:hypothetical protein